MESPLESHSGPAAGKCRAAPAPERVPLEELLAHSGWAHGLARRLVAESGLADDVLQETWLAALRRPSGAIRHARAWLATAVTHTARQLGRGERRRERRERAAARPEPLPSAAELAESLDLQRKLASCVLALEPPYRETLILRFYRDLTPLAIARAQGVPAGTVRSRLRRGLELLRARLDAEWGGDRRAWSLALLGGLPRASVPAPNALLSGAGLAAVGLGLLAGLGWLAATWLARAPEPSAGVATRAALTAPLETGAETGAEAESSRNAAHKPASAGGAPVTREARAPEATALLAPAYVGRVQAPDGTPIEGATLSLYPNKSWPRPTPIGVGTSGPDGRFRIVAGLTDSTYITIGAEAPGYQGLTMDPVVTESEIPITLAWTVVVTGTVRDAEGHTPLAGVVVECEQERTLSDEEGRYRIERVVTGNQVRIGARRIDHAPAEQSLFLRANEPASLDLELEAGLPLEVEVVQRETGRPLADAPIRSDPFHEPWTRTDARGRFPLRVLPGIETKLAIDGEGGLWSYWNWVPPDEVPENVRWPVQAVGWIEGVVRDAKERPLEGVSLYATCEAEPFLRFSLPEEERCASGAVGTIQHEIETVASEAVTDERGAFRLPVVPGEAPFGITAYLDGYVTRRAGPFDARTSAGRRGLELVLEPAAIVRGHVQENGEPWRDGDVRWEHADGRLGRGWITTKGYELRDLPPGSVRLWVEDDWPSRLLGEPVTLELSAGEVREQDFAWTVALLPVTGRVLGTDGRPRGGVNVGAESLVPGASGDFTVTDEDGAFVLHVPAEGEVRLRAWDETVQNEERRAAPGDEGLELVLADAGMLRLLLVEADSGDPARVRDGAGLSASRMDGTQVRLPHRPPVDVHGGIEIPLAIGRYDLHLAFQEDGYLPLDLPGIEVVPALASPAAPPLRVALVRGVELELRLLEAPLGAEALGASAGPGDLRPERDHLLFLVERHQEPAISGPFAEQGPPATCRLNGGIVMRVADPDLMAQWLRLDPTGRARLRGLARGVYTLRAYPDDSTFDPPELELGAEPRVTRTIRWRSR